MFEKFIVGLFHGYAYQPLMVYGSVVVLMLASSFGLPLPEEITLVSSGFLAYIGRHPELYPPPFVGAPVVNVHILAAVAFCAVLGSDTMVYTLGRLYGSRVLDSRLVKRFIHDEHRNRINVLTAKYGLWAVALFRFMPGVRFPGHIACGALGISAAKFLLVDAIAALVSVPTQIYLVAFYGKQILTVLDEVKIVIGILLVVFLVYYFGRKYLRARRRRATS